MPTGLALDDLRRALRGAARPGDAEFLQRFFKTGPGEYSEGDRFLGVRVPAVRKLLPQTDGLRDGDLLVLVRSEIHEERLLGLLVWVRRFGRSDEPARRQIFRAYLREAACVNNWDLVDTSAPAIVGGWIAAHPADRNILLRLARSECLWERRIAIVSTLALIRRGDLEPTTTISALLVGDPHDLIHKASGWMLREAGKRDPEALRGFLEEHAATMPRTMLRYAIEKLGPAERRRWLKKRGAAR
ncbi:MAG TPA: DNA alkylation repair protein [Terrimicrobiaceae bacterium]|nr:DNA alkylation repair protein [Terrimicrobiaceae bacterium]